MDACIHVLTHSPCMIVSIMLRMYVHTYVRTQFWPNAYLVHMQRCTYIGSRYHFIFSMKQVNQEVTLTYVCIRISRYLWSQPLTVYIRTYIYHAVCDTELNQEGSVVLLDLAFFEIFFFIVLRTRMHSVGHRVRTILWYLMFR